jgi:hypothetical protein
MPIDVARFLRLMGYTFIVEGSMTDAAVEFPILVADADDVVGLVGSRLLIAALDNKSVKIEANVQVAVQSPTAVKLSLQSLPQLPNAVALICQQVKVASPRFSRNAALVLGFSGIDIQMVQRVRSFSSTTPVVNLCSFVPALETDLSQIHGANATEKLDNAARQFSTENDLLDCVECKSHREDDEAYWLNIADVCARFAVAISKK